MRAALSVFIPLTLLGVGCGDVTLVDDRETTGILDVNLGEIAVITGDYERSEEMLAQVNATFTLVDGYIDGGAEGSDLVDYPDDMPPVEDFLSDDEQVLAFDTLLLNCGIRGAGGINPQTLEPERSLLERADVRRNLRNFVANGGVVYVSDQSYALVEAAIPELFDFRGADEAVGEALQGAESLLTGTVQNEALQTALGGQVEVELTERWAMVNPIEGAWVTAEAPIRRDDGVVYVAPDTPLITRRSHGEGEVVFSSFHNSAEVNQGRTELQIQLLRAMGGAF